MEGYRLTDYGTIIDYYGNENNVDYCIKMWRKKGNNLSFSKNDSCFSLEDDEYNAINILLSKKQKDLLNLGTPSSDVLKLIAYSEECQYKEKEEAINNQFLNTGEFPTDTEELAILNEYYRKELLKTNASIIKNSIISCVMPFTGALTGAAIYTAFSPEDLAEKAFFAAIAAIIGGAASLISGVIIAAFDKDPMAISEIKYGIKEKGILEKKIKCLNESEEKRLALEIKKTYTPEGLENKEMSDVTNCSNVFLQELEEVKKKIALLPEDEREPYIRELISIVQYYKLQITVILGKDANKIEFGSAANLWDLNTSMLPKLFDLGSRLDLRIATIKERQELQGTLNEFTESVETLGTDNGYTDGYSDDLTSSGVAYATMENGTVAGRRMA